MDIQKIGNFIKSERNSRNLSQEELASILNVSRSTISKWENGNRMPDLVSLSGLSKLFEVQITELLSGERNIETYESEKVTVDALNYVENISKRKYVKITALIVFILLIIFITYLITNYYTRYDVYKINGCDETFCINGYILDNVNDKTLIINSVNTENNESTLIKNITVTLYSNGESFHSEMQGFEEYQSINNVLKKLTLSISKQDGKKINYKNLSIVIEYIDSENSSVTTNIDLSVAKNF